MKMTVEQCERFLNEYVSPRLDQIAAGFLDPNVKVTLIVRSEAAPNGELVATSDELAEVRAVIDRREAANIVRYRSIDPGHVI